MLWTQRSRVEVWCFGLSVAAVAVAVAVGVIKRVAPRIIAATADFLPGMHLRNVFIAALLRAETGAPRGPRGDDSALLVSVMVICRSHGVNTFNRALGIFRVASGSLP